MASDKMPNVALSLLICKMRIIRVPTLQDSYEGLTR